MKRSSAAIAASGAVAGIVAALGATAMAAGLLVDGAAQAIPIRPRLSLFRPLIEAQDLHLYLYVVAAGLVIGAVLAVLTSRLATQVDPGEPRLGVAPLAIAGAVVGAVVSYAALRVGIGVGGQIDQGLVTISAFRAIVIFASVGAAVGAASSVTAERLSRPAVVGVGGEAWPASRTAFIKEATPAMLIPLLALGVIAALVFGVSRALLAGDNVLAVTLGTILSIGILGGGALLAYRPRPEETEPD